ncbi:MAG: hypothetical protein AB7P34_21625, partial [Vicinamibacterales bacterium]
MPEGGRHIDEADATCPKADATLMKGMMGRPLPEEPNMRLTRVLLALVTSVALTGCINSTTLIKLNPDGSGTVEQTTLMNLAAIKGMMPGAEKQMGGAVVNQADLERTAARMGRACGWCRRSRRRAPTAGKVRRPSSPSTT